ncbi:MAG TPA: hypothetical protein V6D22_23755 [Candidatus Obscuribacterales bacterium]
MAQTLTGVQFAAAVNCLQSKVETRDMPGFHAELCRIPGDDLYAVMIGAMIENRLRRARNPDVPCLVVQAERSGDFTRFSATIAKEFPPPPS